MKHLLNLTVFLWLFVGVGVALGQYRDNYSDNYSDSTIYISTLDQALYKEVSLALKTRPISLEKKIGKSFSINLNPIVSTTTITSETPGERDVIFRSGIDWELRYYHRMADRIKAGSQANNITGRYFALSTTTIISDNSGLGRFGRYVARYGYQRRINKREYIDIGLQLRHTSNPYEDSTGKELNLRTISLSNYSQYGFIFANKAEKEIDPRYGIINYFTNRNSAWRIDINGIFSLRAVSGIENSDNRVILSIRPNITYERKIAGSVFSLEQELSTRISVGSIVTPSVPLELLESSIRYSIGGKYYFKMKKKQLEGKSGNNLSGVYLFARVSHTEKQNKTDGFTEFGIGLQRELLNNFFLDLNVYGRVRNYGSRYANRILETPFVLDISVSYALQ